MGANSAASPSAFTLPSLAALTRAAAALHLRALADGLPVGAESPERRALVGACPNVGRDLRDALAEALADAERRADEAAVAAEAARDFLAATIADARALREAVRVARDTGDVPALPALGDNNSRRWHPVDGWQDGNEPPTDGSPYALGLALAEADALAGGTAGADAVKRAAAEAIADAEDREDAEREAAHGDGFDD